MLEKTETDDELRRSALGLLVLQRAMLASEDLGGLLIALHEPPSFARLLSYDLDDLGGVFRRLALKRDAVPNIYGFLTPEAIDAEPGMSDAQRAALRRLRAVTLHHVRQQLADVLQFWESLHAAAKKTMHGLSFVSGLHLQGRPGAGCLQAYAPEAHPRPFVLSLDSVIDHGSHHARTEVSPIDLSSTAVAQMVNAGLAACDAAEILVGGRLHGLETNHAMTLPSRFLDELEPAEREELASVFTT
jgi:hypothetical protein